MLLSVPSRKLELALVDLGHAPTHHGDVLLLATVQELPKDVVVRVVFHDLDAHLIPIPTMTDHAKALKEVAVSKPLTRMAVAASPAAVSLMAAGLLELEAAEAVADLCV